MLIDLIPIFIFRIYVVNSNHLFVIHWLPQKVSNKIFFRFTIGNLPKLNSQSYETISPNEIVFFHKKLPTEILMMGNFCFIF